MNQFQTGLVIGAGTPCCSAASTSPETRDSISTELEDSIWKHQVHNECSHFEAVEFYVFLWSAILRSKQKYVNLGRG